ncbi:MAG: phosphate/phosphite/phosphonate ABC transporter substrate-binding protein [Proteobacteria bacterium]|nr:phosphate/phosphite/phosphonate ABC transporter substrate-binding protein [Pseudomonadota bacterium]
MTCFWSAALIGLLFSSVGCSKGSSSGAATGSDRDGSEGKPLVVVLIPTETGSRSVLDDYAPLFHAIKRTHGIHFDLKMGESYNGVIESMVAGHVDIAFLGAVTFDEAKRRGAAELLAVEETKGTSVYYSGIFHRADSGMTGLKDLKGKSIALGDPKSTSSFRYPVAMLKAAGIDPPNDVGKIVMAKSHSGALEQLESGHVDAAGVSLNAFDKVVESGAVDGKQVALLAKSDPIPSPPLAMHTGLSADVKARLKKAFHSIHRAEGVTKEMILGYGGKKVDRYNTEFDVKIFDQAMQKLSVVSADLISEIIDKAGRR